MEILGLATVACEYGVQCSRISSNEDDDDGAEADGDDDDDDDFEVRRKVLSQNEAATKGVKRAQRVGQ